jgi:hypothetical protein
MSKGWVTFRQILQVHHAAEDDDLWPVLPRHLTDGQDLHQLDLMVAEHRDLEAAIQAVDAVLTGNGGVRTAAAELGEVLRGYLDHEELAELVDGVIGVDTHRDTLTAAVNNLGGVLAHHHRR